MPRRLDIAGEHSTSDMLQRPDWRGLCEELTEHLALLDEPPHELVCRAQNALAQPEPEVVGPSDEELLELWQGWNLGWDPQKGTVLMPHPAEYARAVLARYGRPAITPIPVSERLPGPEDCDADGFCWCSGSCSGYDTDPDERFLWSLSRIADENDYCDPVKLSCTHWLPFHALPPPPSDHHLSGD